MGFVGGYTLHLYCDHPNHVHDGTYQSEFADPTRNGSYRLARAAGWSISTSEQVVGRPTCGQGTTMCPLHSGKVTWKVT
jgi:hypothetical protein